MEINFIDLKAQYQQYKEEIDSQMREVINNANFIMGVKIKELEKQLATFTTAKHAITCASGTDALLLALMAYNIQPGDEIITTPFTFIATSEVVSFLKATPIFVDINPDTFNIAPELIAKAITDKTKGIIPVDLFGQCADYDKINKIANDKGLFVIEDAAQSLGAKYKDRPACSLSDIGCTSFFPAKPLGCFGDGGAVFTDNDDKAMLMRSFRTHGSGTHKYENVRIGINARLDTLQAAVLLVKLKYFSREIEARNKAATYYNKNLCDKVKSPFIKEHNLSVYGQYVIQAQQRDELQKFLKEKNIPTAIHYPKTLHLQKAFSGQGYKEGDFPVAEAMCKKVLALPMHPFLTREVQDFIIGSINDFYSKN